MPPALDIVLGLLFLAGGGFVVVQGRRARAQAAAIQKPLPAFFKVAVIIHLGIALVGLILIARGVSRLAGM
jgi:hypothetical protein